jgi:cobalt/nickel transport system ATP-binding protein
VGLLFQNSDDQLFSPTVLEDVAFGPLNLGHKPPRAREIAAAALERVGLEGFGERVTHRLSGGEKKLVALASILAMQPKALLLDEPTNDLDPDTRDRLRDVLLDLDLSYIVISHDWDFLDETTDDVYALHDGRLLHDGKAAIHRHVHIHPHGDVPHEHEG